LIIDARDVDGSLGAFRSADGPDENRPTRTLYQAG
jgi:hypothetical protein